MSREGFFEPVCATAGGGMENVMKRNPVITIARQYGSRGSDIAKRLGEILGIKAYDKELIQLAAERSGYHRDVLEKADEKAAGSLLYAIATSAPSMFGGFGGHYDIPINDKLFIVQNNVIQELAASEQCIIIGRCGDYALRNFEDKLCIFIYADIEDRVKYISDIKGISESEAELLISKEDKRRASYYNFYTGQKWGAPDRYAASINSSKFGIEGTAQIIADMVKRVSE